MQTPRAITIAILTILFSLAQMPPAFSQEQSERPIGLAIVADQQTVDEVLASNQYNQMLNERDYADFLEYLEGRSLLLVEGDGYWLAVQLESLVGHSALIQAELIAGVLSSKELAVPTVDLRPDQISYLKGRFSFSQDVQDTLDYNDGAVMIMARVNFTATYQGDEVRASAPIRPEASPPFRSERTSPPVNTPELSPAPTLWDYSFRELLTTREPARAHRIYSDLLNEVIEKVEEETRMVLAEAGQEFLAMLEEFLSERGLSLSDLRSNQPLPSRLNSWLAGNAGTDPHARRDVNSSPDRRRDILEHGNLTSANITFYIAVGHAGAPREFVNVGLVIPIPLGD